jgi:hypothetical protein
MDKFVGISEKRNLLTTTTKVILLVILVALLSGCAKGYYYNQYPPLWAEVEVKTSKDYKLTNLTNSAAISNNPKVHLNNLLYYPDRKKYYKSTATNEYFDQSEFDNKLGLPLNILFENYKKYVDAYTSVLIEVGNKYSIKSNTIDTDSYEITINDTSGLYNDEIDPSKGISLYVNNFIPLPELPNFCMPPKDFISFINTSQISTRYAAEIVSYEEKAKSESLYYITLNNSPIRYKATIDKSVLITPSSPQSKTKIRLTILSKDFDVKLPPYIERDENIIVIFTGKYLNFINISNVYLRIHEASLYYNKKISPIKFEPFELPPNATFEKPIPIETTNIRQDIYTDATWNDMTAKKANEIEVTFGFAVKYERHEASNAVLKTFFQLDKYNLYYILKDTGQGSYKELWDKNKDEFNKFDIPSELKPQVSM